MKTKLQLSSCVLLALSMGIAFLPGLSSAAEFSFAGPPAFTVTYPDGSTPNEKTAPEQVWAIKTPSGLVIQASVAPIPEGVELKDAAEKAYKPGLEKKREDQSQDGRKQGNHPVGRHQGLLLRNGLEPRPQRRNPSYHHDCRGLQRRKVRLRNSPSLGQLQCSNENRQKPQVQIVSIKCFRSV